MPVEKQYEGDQDQKDFAALRDLKQWLNGKQWAAMKNLMRHETDPNSVVMAMAFAGVQGYPVSAAIRTYGNKELKRRNQESLEEFGQQEEEEYSNQYAVDVFYEDPVTEERHWLGKVLVWAEDDDEASTTALDKLWEPRLSQAGCLAVTKVSPLEQ